MTAFALASSATRSSAACSRSRRTSSTRRSRCSAAPITPAAVSSAASSDGIDGALLARVVEAHHPDELAGHEDRHDRLGLGADALDARGGAGRRDLARAQADAAPGAQLARTRLEKLRSSHEQLARLRSGTASRPGPVHSLTTTSSGSPCGPVRVSMRLTRSTWAASPISPSTRGIAARTSGASSSRRLAAAEAVSSRSRACSDSLISLSFSAQGAGSAVQFQQGDVRVHVGRYSQALQRQI